MQVTNTIHAHVRRRNVPVGQHRAAVAVRLEPQAVAVAALVNPFLRGFGDPSNPLLSCGPAHPGQSLLQDRHIADVLHMDVFKAAKMN